MKLKVVFLWLCISASIIGYGQIHKLNLDSLRLQLNKAQADTTKVQIFLQIGEQFDGNRVDSAIFFYKQAGQLSQKINYPVGHIKYLASYSELLNHQGKFDQALKLNLKSVEVAKQNGLKLQLAKSYANVAVSYQYKQEFETSLLYYLKAIPIFEALNYDDGLYVLYSNLCGLYESLSQYEKSLHFGDKALGLARKQNNKYGIALAQINRAYTFMQIKKYQEAIQANQDGYRIGKEINSVYIQKSALANLTELYLKQKLYAEAIPIANKTVQLSRSLGDIDGKVNALSSLATAYLYTKNFAKAKYYAAQALAYCRTHDLKEEWKKIALKLAQIELSLGNTEAYASFQAEGDSLAELIMNENVKKNLQELEVKYETTKKENHIKQLIKEKEIQKLKTRQQHTLNYVFIGSIIILLFLGILYYRNTRNQKIISHQTQKLQEQRIKELEQAQQLLAVNAMLQGQEAERRRLAKDLHDGLGGMLSGVKLYLSNLQENLFLSKADNADFSKALKQLDETTQELRRVAHSLMPEALVRFGLECALKDFCSKLGKSAHLQINLQTFGMQSRLEPEVEVIVYRVVQELLNNVVKHAQATEVIVQLIRTADSLSLIVEDNGVGFNTTDNFQGIGLSNIRSRVDYLHGNLDIHAVPSVGTTVSIDFTIGKRADEVYATKLSQLKV